MATGAPSSRPRRAPGDGALTPAGKARAVSAEDKARISALLQAAGRAHHGGNADRLKAVLEEILEIDPTHPNANYNLGIFFRDRDDIFKAEVHIRRAIKHDPHLIDAFQGLADLLFGAKHLLPAAKLYEQAL